MPDPVIYKNMRKILATAFIFLYKNIIGLYSHFKYFLNIKDISLRRLP